MMQWLWWYVGIGVVTAWTSYVSYYRSGRRRRHVALDEFATVFLTITIGWPVFWLLWLAERLL